MGNSGRVTTVRRERGYHRIGFVAMGSPCELLVTAASDADARSMGEIVSVEAWRIEDKFSRYLSGNVVSAINSGVPTDVDDETANMLDFAATLHAISNGRFDITSGVLRKAWTFDGSDNVPGSEEVEPLLDRIGWSKVSWNRPTIELPTGMQIDLGGIAKEYAVDRAADLVGQLSSAPCLINFGGDLVATSPPPASDGWKVGIDAFAAANGHGDKSIRLANGALATSGDARRYLLKDGVRYAHILDPTTGWPVVDAPRSVTVAADTCTEAGILATLSMLKGEHAESFLEAQGVKFWCYR